MRRDELGAETAAVELRFVARGVLRAGRGPAVEMRQLHAQHGGLQRVEPAVDADEVMVVPRLLPVVAQHPQLRGQLAVVGRDHAAVAEAAEILGRIEAQAAERAERAGPPAVDTRRRSPGRRLR